ncbi:hypothetical protein BDA96_01G239500 [Sorghum bicolor]|uniref:Uncharacterized protein n=2 Tax=Sorghum bicolor TaxID=4558 RepID=A0A921S0W2_SORBI|nr:hypothetical protein BDA96_01G239500 [Sorghum bicolor]KXG38373.1 hypothetical protein SORBI_3001G225000 [Sorghum bicolor]
MIQRQDGQEAAESLPLSAGRTGSSSDGESWEKRLTAAAQAEAEEELEAVAAVYGDDIRVLRDLVPHLVVHMRPRTTDDSS